MKKQIHESGLLIYRKNSIRKKYLASILTEVNNDCNNYAIDMVYLHIVVEVE